MLEVWPDHVCDSLILLLNNNMFEMVVDDDEDDGATLRHHKSRVTTKYIVIWIQKHSMDNIL